MAKTLTYLGVVVLVIIAVVLGYKIYQQITSTNQSIPTSQQSEDRTIPQSVDRQEVTPKTSTSSDQNSNPEDWIYRFPGDNATQEEKQQFSDNLNRFAKQTEVLEISNNCKSSPLVMRIKKDQEFQIKNTSGTDIKIIISTQYQIPIGANTAKTVKAYFGGIGAFGYRCEGFEKISGIIDII